MSVSVIKGILIGSLALSASAYADLYNEDDGLDVKHFQDPSEAKQGRSVEDQDLEGFGITQREFNSVIDVHERVYRSITSQIGASLSVARLWNDNTENANASKQGGSRWHINMYGGLARNRNITKDGFALVLCHEMGHLVAGFPAYNGSTNRFSMMGNEGNSDYFATFVCANKIWRGQESLVVEIDEDDPVSDFCRKVGNPSHCVRKLRGSKGLATFLNGGRAVSFTNHDRNKVTRTKDQHPRGQFSVA